MGACLINPNFSEYGDVDTCIVNLRLDNGALAVIDNSRQAVYGYDQRVEVFGSKGCITAANASTRSGPSSPTSAAAARLPKERAKAALPRAEHFPNAHALPASLELTRLAPVVSSFLASPAPPFFHHIPQGGIMQEKKRARRLAKEFLASMFTPAPTPEEPPSPDTSRCRPL